MTSFVNIVWLIIIISAVASCTAAGPGVFGKKSLHEQYGNKISDAGLKETTLGSLWFAAAEKALNSPSAIKTPHKEIGYFAAEKPSAVGLKFFAKKGEKLLFELNKRPASGFLLFVELWNINSSGKPNLLQAFDTTQTKFDYEIEDAGEYILRIQPELLKSGEYTLSVSVGSILGFPVAGKNAKIGSIWGDDRDAGTRSHEGIDIFAPKRTPAVAAYEGTVTRVNENNLGGKTVWLRPKGKDYTLYYAHLDEQLATAGQKVNKGDTIGLVGNTGNARTTPPHLHFGIYTFGGAVDPLPFVNPNTKIPANVSVSVDELKTYLRLKKEQQVKVENTAFQLGKNTFLKPIAATSNQYRMELPDGTIVDIPGSLVEETKTAVKQSKPKAETFIFDAPDKNSPRKTVLKTSDTIKVLAYFNDYAFVSFNDIQGWVPVSEIS